MNLYILISAFLFKWLFCSEALDPNTSRIIESINKKVHTKYPQVLVPVDWPNQVLIKYYPEDSSIKVHCSRESDAPFGRTLIRNLFKIYKQNFPEDNSIKKMKLSSQVPSGKYITAYQLSEKGYLKSLYELIDNLPISEIQNEKSFSIIHESPNIKMSVSSPSSISEIQAFSYPIYVFYTNEEEKLKQESMIHLLLQLGFNVFQYRGNPFSAEFASTSLKIPEFFSPEVQMSLSKNQTSNSDINVFNKTTSTNVSISNSSKC